MSTQTALIKSRAEIRLRRPIFALLRRYCAIFIAAWDRRDEIAGPRRLLDEQAFLPAAIALQETPPHPAPRRATVAICALFTLGLLWACFGQIDIVAVAQGHVIVDQRSKTIQPLETSVVKAIRVKDGDKVKAGDLLIELDGTITAADSARVAEERSSAISEVLRSRALLVGLRQGGEPVLDRELMNNLVAADRSSIHFQLQSEWADIGAKLARYSAEATKRKAEIATAAQVVQKFQSTLPLARQREKDFKELTEQGFVAGHAGQDRMRERIEMEQDLATAQARLEEARAALAETEQALIAYRAETSWNLRDRNAQAELKARQLAEDSTKAEKRNDLTRLTAPVAGTVQQLAVHTLGGVVTPAQVLLVLVPADSAVTADVVLENKDIGFVQAGQVATIKLETFPYTRYGTVEAKVESITAEAVQDEKRGAIFPASLLLGASTINVDGKLIKLAPGMNLTAEIKTGKRRVIDYLLSPVQQYMHESLTER